MSHRRVRLLMYITTALASFFWISVVVAMGFMACPMYTNIASFTIDAYAFQMLSFGLMKVPRDIIKLQL